MYESFYSLSRRPFSLTPDQRFLFPSRGHQRALSYLLYGLEQREGFVVITGDVGTGKTLLIQTLFAELAHKKMATARLAAANLSAEGVLPMVAAAFGRPYEGLGKVSLMRDLESTLLRDPEYRDGALLVVDEAQTFTREALEELRILSNWEVDGRALIQIFLVGQTELRGILAERGMTQLRQRVIASHHLEPLNREETEAYIRHRLSSGDWDGDPDLVPDSFDAVYRWSGGIPRRINLLMDRVLLFGYLEELHRLDADSIDTVIEELQLEDGGIDDPPAATRRAAVAAPAGAPLEAHDLEERLTTLEAGFRLLMRYASKPQRRPAADESGEVGVGARIAALEADMQDALDDAVSRELDRLSFDVDGQVRVPSRRRPVPTPQRPASAAVGSGRHDK